MERSLHDTLHMDSEYRNENAEEMCSQFSKLFIQNEDKYCGEQALLKVLLHRLEKDGEDHASLAQELEVQCSANDDHQRRRAMISLLLGLKSDPAQSN